MFVRIRVHICAKRATKTTCFCTADHQRQLESASDEITAAVTVCQLQVQMKAETCVLRNQSKARCCVINQVSRTDMLLPSPLRSPHHGPRACDKVVEH